MKKALLGLLLPLVVLMTVPSCLVDNSGVNSEQRVAQDSDDASSDSAGQIEHHHPKHGKKKDSTESVDVSVNTDSDGERFLASGDSDKDSYDSYKKHTHYQVKKEHHHKVIIKNEHAKKEHAMGELAQEKHAKK